MSPGNVCVVAEVVCLRGTQQHLFSCYPSNKKRHFGENQDILCLIVEEGCLKNISFFAKHEVRLEWKKNACNQKLISVLYFIALSVVLSQERVYLVTTPVIGSPQALCCRLG